MNWLCFAVVADAFAAWLCQSGASQRQQPHSGAHTAVCLAGAGRFLRCVNQELLGQEQPVIAAKTYFQRATQAIDELLALVDAALAQLQPR